MSQIFIVCQNHKVSLQHLCTPRKDFARVKTEGNKFNGANKLQISNTVHTENINSIAARYGSALDNQCPIRNQ